MIYPTRFAALRKAPATKSAQSTTHEAIPIGVAAKDAMRNIPRKRLRRLDFDIERGARRRGTLREVVDLRRQRDVMLRFLGQLPARRAA